MSQDLQVLGAITVGGLSVLTTGTGYIQSQTYSTAEISELLTSLTTYLNTQVDTREPSFTTAGVVLKSLNFETGAIEIILDPAFIEAALAGSPDITNAS